MIKPKLPKIFNFAEKRRQKIQAIECQTIALQKQNEIKDEALKAIVKMSNPIQTLNNELYGTGNRPYASKIWQSSATEARRLSRIAYWESPAAQAMISRFVDLVYGPKLDLQAAPVWDIIPGNYTDEQKAQIIKNIEARYRLWAKSRKSDYIGDKNHYQRSRQLFENLLLDGEYFVLLRYPATRKRNPLSVQIIKPDYIQRVDSRVNEGNHEENGIEYNAKGAAVAYHFLQANGKSKRVPKYGPKSGRQFVIHNKLGDGRRGIGILAGIITELTKLADFQALEIQAAVVNALFAVVIETAIGGENKPWTNKKGVTGTNLDSKDGLRYDYSDYETKLQTTQTNHGGFVVQNLGEGQTAKSFDTKRPTANFELFFQAVKRNLYAAKGMSLAVADYNFDGSYSAARGELLVLWNKVMTFRFDHSCDYEDIEYKMWLFGEIEKGNVDMPGFLDDETLQDAWSNATWTGPQRPDIDPEKSLKAHQGEINEGLKTRQQVAAERGGGDYDENIDRLKKENEMLTEVNKPLIELDKTSFSFSENKTESKTESKNIDTTNNGGNE